MAGTRRTVRVAGLDVDEATFISKVRAKEAAATRRLVRQLREDGETGSSLGIRLVSAAFGREVAAFISRITHPDETDVESLVLETLQRVYTRIGSYEATRSAFRTWVYEQARYAALDWRREREKTPEPLEPDEVDAGRPVEADLSRAADPAQASLLLSNREAAAVRRAFRTLKPTERELLWRRYVEGWTPSEMSRAGFAKGVPEEHVRVYVNRAAKKLAAALQREME
jgi:RNA polymerase sigma factor (sigma-70 family)